MEKEFGFKKLVVWKNSAILRKMIYDLTERFPKVELRRISQMRDAARSVKQNIQEGYARAALGDYIRGLEIARGSLAELMGAANSHILLRRLSRISCSDFQMSCGSAQAAGMESGWSGLRCALARPAHSIVGTARELPFGHPENRCLHAPWTLRGNLRLSLYNIRELPVDGRH